MPYWCIASKVNHCAPGLHAAFEIAERYAASPEATLRRLVEQLEVPAAAVFLELRHKKQEERSLSMPAFPGLEAAMNHAPPQLRIARRPHLNEALRRRRVFFPLNKSVPADSACWKALRQRQAGLSGICRGVGKLGHQGSGSVPGGSGRLARTRQSAGGRDVPALARQRRGTYTSGTRRKSEQPLTPCLP